MRNHFAQDKSILKYLLIALGGSLGSVARYWVSVAMASLLGASFPYGTLSVNLAACLAIGFAIPYMGKQAYGNSPWRFLLAIGFIGAFSTYSTFEWDTLAMLRNGPWLLAAIYAGASLLFGLAAVWCGSRLAMLFSLKPLIAPSPEDV